MTVKQFTAAMVSLGCSVKKIRQTSAMIWRFCRSYKWLVLDEIHSIALDDVAKANATFDPEGGSSAASYYITVVRSSIITHIRREKKVRSRFRALNSGDDEGVYIDQDATLDGDHMLGALSKIVSPSAWAIVRMTLREHPKKVTNAKLSRVLRLSPRSVSMLRREIHYAGVLLNRKDQDGYQNE